MRASTPLSASRRIDPGQQTAAPQAEALLAAIVASSDDAIFSRSQDGMIRTWNASAEWLYGYSAEEIIGQTIAVLEPVDLRGQAEAAFCRVLAGGPPERLETRRLHMDGSEVHVSVHLSPIVEGATVTGVSSIARDVTAQREAEAALRESGNRMAEAQRLAHIGNWSLDTATGRRTWSDELYRIYGYEPGAFEPDLEHFFDRLHPDDADRVRTAILSNLPRALPSENEFRLVLPGGEVRWLAARTEPVLDDRGGVIGLHGITQDVTERKEVEERLRFQAHLLDAVGEAVIATDLNGRIVYWGPGAEELYGWAAQEALTRLIGEVMPSDATAEAVAEIMGRLAQGERWTGLMELRRRDGSTFLAEIADTPVLDAAGQLVAVIGISTDVSARERDNAELAAARDAALKASLLKSHFLANMSHEIRTPMNGILGMTELLLDSPLDASQRQFAETVRVSGDALLTIINEILDLSKVEAGVVELESVDFELLSVIQSVTDLLAGAAAAKGLDLEVHVADDVPALRGDPLRIRQVLTNLIGNAVKFTPAGCVAVSARVVATDGAPTTVRLQVDDTGIGLAPDETQRVFEPFAQADSSTTRRFGGTGLGLTITRQIVDLMGGRCGVDSKLGEGSSFWCTLPLVRAAGIDTAPARASRPGPGSPDVPAATAIAASGGAVLLAEDNLINRRVTLAMLEGGGYRVDVALDGAEALSAVRAGHYDVILMDCQMPLMDGYEAAAAIRAEEGPGRRVPIVAMTAGAMPEDRERALAAGMDDYLAKPVKKADVLAAVSHWARVSLGTG